MRTWAIVCTLAFGLGLAHGQENVERSAEGDELAAMQAERRIALVVGNSA